MPCENILFDVADGVARNALSWGMAFWRMARDIGDALDRLKDARVLVITGASRLADPQLRRRAAPASFNGE